MNKTHKLRGMTLVESAIVLAIVGLVVGAIWAAGANVRQKYEIQEATDLVMQVAERVRNAYTGFPNATLPSTTAAQITAKLFPENIIAKSGSSDTTVNPWGGAVQISFKTNATTGQVEGFGVALQLPSPLPLPVSRNVCSELIGRLPGIRNGTGTTTLNGVPLPVTSPAREAGQGASPATVYINNGSWVDVTNKTSSSIAASSFSGTAKCTGVAFYFWL